MLQSARYNEQCRSYNKENFFQLDVTDLQNPNYIKMLSIIKYTVQT